MEPLFWIVAWRSWAKLRIRTGIRDTRDQVCRGIWRKFLDDLDLSKLDQDLHVISLGYSALELDDLFNGIRELLDETEKTISSMIVAPLANDVREAYAVVVAAVVLLSYIYLYLTGCGGWDGSRSVSSGSLDYRDTYIAIVLFRGAYVWIKFRDVASTKPKGVRLLATGKYELRFKPRRENGVPFDYIHIGRFDSKADAEIVYRMIVSCYPYGEDCGGLVDLAGDGRELFPITPEFTLEDLEEIGRVGKAKHNLVKKRALEHYKRYKTKKDALNLPPISPGANLEQELQNRRLQKENEDLAYKLQQSEDLQRALQLRIEGIERQVQHLPAQENLQQAQQFQFQNSHLQVEDQQAQQNLLQASQFRIEGLERQVQHPPAQENLQQTQQFQFQNSHLQVEDLQCPVQDQQAQQNLLQASQFRIEGLERQVQHPQAQQFQNSQLQVEDLQRPVQDQQAQHNFLQELLFRIEGLERQVQLQQAQQKFQQAQQFQFQNSQLQVEDLQRPVQHQQAQQLQVPNLQPQPPLPHLQQQQRQEPSADVEFCDMLFGTDPLPEQAWFGAESTNLWGDIQLMDETTT